MGESFGKARHMNVNAFLEEFAQLNSDMENRRYCFLLGAGASKSSGIKLGGELATAWLNELHQEQAPTGQSLEDWATAENLSIPGFELRRAASFYPQIYGRKFEGCMDRGQCWIENELRLAIPSSGYHALAQILHCTRHKIVITTNFDDLVATAHYRVTGSLPRIIHDANIAHHLSPQSRTPILVKLHGTIGFATTKNAPHEISTLDRKWVKPLRHILAEYVPIVIGWEGNDGSLMTFLIHTMCNTKGESMLPGGIFWCHRPDKTWQQRVNDNALLKSLCEKHVVRFISIEGFDDLMMSLADRILSTDDLEDLRKEKLRINAGNNSQANIEPSRKQPLPEFVTQVDTHSIGVGDPLTSILQLLDSDQRVSRLLELANQNPGDAQVLSSLATALLKSTTRKQEAGTYFESALVLDPNNSRLLGNYALYLTTVAEDHDLAEEYFNRSLVADPANAIHIGNFANFMADVRGNHDGAETLYTKAIAIAPCQMNILVNYAAFLCVQRLDVDKAEHFYKIAVDVDPHCPQALGNYALFLQHTRQDPELAEVFHERALSCNTRDAVHVGNYALLMQEYRHDLDRAQELYQLSIELDPHNANNLGNYACFLHSYRNDACLAQQYYRRALENAPDHARNLGNYANFLANLLKDYESAKHYYEEAIRVDPQNAQNVGNYAYFLDARLRHYESAMRFYENALQLDPNHVGNLSNYAVFLELQRGDYTAAGAAYRKLLEIDRDNVNGLRNYALLQERYHRDDDEADKYYRKALAISPTDPVTLRFCAVFYHQRRGDVAKAEDLFRRALKYTARDFVLLSSYAVFLQEGKKDYERAEQFYQKALANGPVDATTLANFAEFLLLHRTARDAAGVLIAEATQLIESPTKDVFVALFFVASLVLHSNEQRANATLLGAIKHLVTSARFFSTWQYAELICWIDSHITPPDKAEFWVAIAKACEGSIPLEALDQYPRWRDIPAVPIEDGLREIGAMQVPPDAV